MSNQIIPYLLYADVAGALDFLSRAFGFEERLRYTGPEGYVSHAELRLGDGIVFLGDPGDAYRNPEQLGGHTVLVTVYVDDVDVHCERARAAGAQIVEEPADQVYGERRYGAVDPEGHHWSFGQVVRHVEPKEWGAEVRPAS